jgi:hypothetical protein
MRKRIVVVDDFLPKSRVDTLHETLMRSEFKDEKAPDGVTYPTVCTSVSIGGVEELLGEVHGVPRVNIKLSCFRLSLLGERDDTFCHADGIYAKWAAVLYLNKHIQSGGTAFWTHRETGLDGVPDDDLMKVAGFHPIKYHQWLTAETNNPSKWESGGFCGMKYNRLVTYPTSSFHSRIPANIDRPFGNTVSDGRLVWVAFYDLP